MNKKITNTDYIFLVMFGVGALVVFAIELIFPNPQPSQRETNLYNALEFGLSIGFGWILQRIDSSKQFQDSLKRFALSAYRRISDIEKSVYRFLNTISQIRLTYPPGKVHELDILKIIAEEMCNTVDSSIADWVDIIGEELSKKNRIEELQKEQSELSLQLGTSSKDTNTEKRLAELRMEINNLKADLPYMLRNDNFTNRLADDSYPREGRIENLVIDHYFAEAKIYSCITIPIHPKIDLTVKTNLDKVINGKPYSIKIGQNMFSLHAEVYNKDDELVGDIVNPFTNIYKNDYIVSLITLIGSITKVTGTLSITPQIGSDIVLESGEIFSKRSVTGEELWLKISASEHDFICG